MRIFPSEAVIPLLASDGLVAISPSVTADCLTTPCPPASTTFFRIAAPDSGQARAAARLMRGDLKLDRVAVLSDGGPYGAPLADIFEAAFQAAGGSVVLRRDAGPQTGDYNPVLREARTAGAQAVFFGGISSGGACKARSAMAGVFPDVAYFAGGDGLYDGNCITDAGPSADEHLLSMVSASQPGRTNRVAGITATAYSYATYDCAEIAKGSFTSTVAGAYSFQAGGDAVRPAVSVYRVQGGHWTFWENLN